MKTTMKTTIISAALVISSFACAPEAAAQFAGEGNKYTIVTTETPESREASPYKRNAFVLNLGGSAGGANFGIGWLHNFSRHIGWDVISSNVSTVLETDEEDGIFCAQIMTGIRYYWPFREDSNFGLLGAIRSGYGVGGDISGICFDIAAGVNLTRSMYVALAYNIQGGVEQYDRNYTSYSSYAEEEGTGRGFFMFRLGFNF
jgi:hypothetical protein